MEPLATAEGVALPDDLVAQILGLAALLPSVDPPTGVHLAAYRGEFQDTHRAGWRTAVVTTSARPAQEPWMCTDAGAFRLAPKGVGATDDAALANLRAALQHEINRHKYRHLDHAAYARDRATKLRTQAARLDAEADAAPRGRARRRDGRGPPGCAMTPPDPTRPDPARWLARDPQDLLHTIGESRPMRELAFTLYRPNPTNLVAVVQALAHAAGLDGVTPRSHFELLELVRVARLDPADAMRACVRHTLLPAKRPNLQRTFRWLDRLDASMTVCVRRPGAASQESPPCDRSVVLLGLLNGGSRAVPAPTSPLDQPRLGNLGLPVTTGYPAHVADLAYFAGAAEAVGAVEAEAWTFREALVAWGLAPVTGVAWAFRPLRWAARSMDFSVLAPLADATARARIAHGWEPCRVGSVARHLQGASNDVHKLGEYLDGFLCDLAEWERLAMGGAVVPPNEDLAPEDRAFPPLDDALVGRAFRDLPNPYAPLLRMFFHGVMPRWVNVQHGTLEISMPTWARDDA